MNKVTGIKSVDFKISAKGHGVVNFNGPTRLMGDEGKEVENHTMPKLRGYTNLSGKVKNETGYKYKKQAEDIDFKKTPLYVSQNCARHHLFKDQAYDLHFAEKKGAIDILASVTGLLRGYVIPSKQSLKRTSPLLLEDLVDQLGNGNFEQLGRSGERDKSSFFSKTTFGDTHYIGYGSISVEQLQFISLDDKFDRAAMIIAKIKGDEIAKRVESFVQSLDESRTPKVTYHNNYVRNGAIYDEGEEGLMLDDIAVDILITEMLERINGLTIRQAKGYMYVDSVELDYNDGGKMMRIKHDPIACSQAKNCEYAVYYSGR
jgi:hypothetical protein